jgi:2,3-bisphosphoglycerate-independent phosphoglycerate mutase
MTDKTFSSFERKVKLNNLHFVSMTEYDTSLKNIDVAYKPQDLSNTFGEYISKNGYSQLRIAETEKYAHVTYFINGGYPDPLDGEERELIKSPVIHSYADKPEMNSYKMVDKIIAYLEKGRYNFICTNFPNADMVGHTGNLAAGKLAVQAIDEGVGRIAECILKMNGQILLVADHGNAEVMINSKTKEIMTEHTLNPVPCILISNNYKNVKMKKGILADVAPTLLKMMGIDKAKEMTGKPLF